MAWYDDSTITVTGGSPIVTGAGTAFVDNVKAGDALRGPDERLYQIASVNSATSLTLTRNYAGASAAGQAYEIMPLQDALAVLAREAAALIQDYQDIADNAGQGMFGDGSAATPGVRFANDLDTGMWRPSANTIAWATGGVERVRVSAGGLVGIGTAVPSQRLEVDGHIALTQGTYDKKLFFGSSTNYYYTVRASGNDLQIAEADDNAKVRLHIAYPNGNVGIGHVTPNEKLSIGLNTGTAGLENTFSLTNFVDSNLFIRVSGTAASDKRVQIGPTTSTAVTFATSDVERVRLDTTGNLLVNATSPFYSGHVINKSTAAGNAIITLASATTGLKSAVFLASSSEGWNGADAALWLGKQANGRTLNGSGTGNFAGSDYAEYMTKAAGCGTIAKGDVCGVDADGKLSQSWAAAHSFVVKSTDPSLVGGDIWANDLDPRPAPPTEPGAAPVAPTAPEPFTDPEPTPEEDESEGAFAVRQYIWGQAAAAAAATQASYVAAVAGFPALLAAWEDASAAYAADLAAYEAALAGWQAELEAARVKVDRIAFSGQVPANLTGAFSVGDYVVAAEGADDTITAIAVSRATFFASPDHQANRIGKVWAIRGGRAWIDVQHG